MKTGDIYWCTVVQYGNKVNRPCIILEIIDEKKVKILPVTSVISKNNIIKVNMSYIDCCEAIGGFINDTILITEIDTCYIGNVCNCSVTNNLKFLLTLKGIPFGN